MPDRKYCYPGTNVLINKLGIQDAEKFSIAEMKFVSARLLMLQKKPIYGKFDFSHLKRIHKYLFQDLYTWAGQERTVELRKGNIFCPLRNLRSFATDIFSKYFTQCWSKKDNRDAFVTTLAQNFANLNALHPFREGNGRTQREFTRILCLKCGYTLNQTMIPQEMMLEASIQSFQNADNTLLEEIFIKAIANIPQKNKLKIILSEDQSK